MTDEPRPLVGDGPALAGVRRAVARVAPTGATVLILGETGTGKELIARAVHAGSPRRAKPFVPVSCAALAPGLVTSELFGHEAGAFTGAVGGRPRWLRPGCRSTRE
ncbi:MAG: sigma-54 factor interaction domain-containing protein [Gemmataceae bacterium]|nr:sigma-54 factor interaction domain-containing protein [Gemmataceae bacterium]